jgi:hypothetical protein
MSLLEIVQDVCASISLPVPAAVAGANDPTALRMLRLAQEDVESLRSRHNWSQLITETTLTGPSVTDNIGTYTLPTDFQRFLRGGGEPNDVGRNYAMGGPGSVANWQSQRTFPGTSPGQWRKFGNTIKVLGGTASDDLRLEYISKYPVADNLGVAKARFTADSDAPRMPENLVKLGLKWRAANEDAGGARTIIIGIPSWKWGGIPDSSLGPF